MERAIGKLLPSIGAPTLFATDQSVISPSGMSLQLSDDLRKLRSLVDTEPK